MTKQIRSFYSRSQEYDGTQGNFRFRVAPIDLFNLTAANVSATSSSVVASSAIGANDQLFITGFVGGTDTSGDLLAVEVGNTTILSMQLSNSTFNAITTSRDSPIAVAAASSTIRIRTLQASTVNASVWGVLEPTYATLMPL